ncbi:hypothetical protein [Chitinophaga defluvii]|uniref:Uncharacterized protein n=1 Tax=Chitinophaga defluvii TaxID=3163343 RepID=A0ABV2TAY7_9BACT
MEFNNISVFYLKGEAYDEDFNRQTYCMTHLFLRLLGKYEVDTRTILKIDLVPPSLKKSNGSILKKNEFIDKGRVLEYNRNFDITAFLRYPEQERKRCLWNIIFEIMTKAAKQYGWDQAHLKNTYEKGIAADLKNEYWCKEYKTSPDKQLKATVRVDFQMEICLVFADFYTKDGDFVRSELFLDWEPSKAFYHLNTLKSTSWKKEEFILHLKEGEQYNAVMPIGGITWSFEDEYGDIVTLNEQLSSLMLLQERLMKEVYTGDRIQALKLNFIAEEKYLQQPEIRRYHAHSYFGKLSYNDVFDFDTFEKMSHAERAIFMWNRAYEVVKVLAEQTGNIPLLEAAGYAWHKGLELGLKTDYKLLESSVKLHGVSLLATLWMRFNEDKMRAVLKLEKEGRVLLEKSVFSTALGIISCQGIFRKIEAKGDTIIVKGAKNMWELPLKIPVSMETVRPFIQ